MSVKQEISLVVWDWNGTLFDDMEACIAVANDMLRERGLPLIEDVGHYRSLFCFPVIRYYEKLGFDFRKESFPAVAEAYVGKYEAAIKNAKLQAGARELLEGLKARGISQAVVSASGQESLSRQMGPFDIGGYFQACLGIKDNLAAGKATLADAFLNRQRLDRRRVLFIGDSVHDFEVAKSCGCRCILVANGHGEEEALKKTGAEVVGSLKEVLHWMAG